MRTSRRTMGGGVGGTHNDERGARISGITVTPRAPSSITLFFTPSAVQTITNSTNEALQ